MKKVFFFTFFGLVLIASTAIVTFQNWQTYVQRSRMPQSVDKPEITYSDAQAEYLKKIRNLNAQYRKEIEVCESEFEGEFGWYLDMETEERRRFIKDKKNLFGLLEKLMEFDGSYETSQKMLEVLAEPIASTFKNSEVIEAVGYASFCKEKEKEIIIGDLLNVDENKPEVARSILSFLKNELKFLNYPHMTYDLVGIIHNMELLLGRNNMNLYELREVTEEFHNYINLQIVLYKKSGFDYDRGGPKFNPVAQLKTLEFASKFQPKVINMITKMEKDIK